MARPAIEYIELPLPDGRVVRLERAYIYDGDALEPSGVDPLSARAWLDGEPVEVAEALALLAKMADEAVSRAHQDRH